MKFLGSFFLTCEMQLMFATASQVWLKELKHRAQSTARCLDAKFTGLSSAPGSDCLRIYEE